MILHIFGIYHIHQLMSKITSKVVKAVITNFINANSKLIKLYETDVQQAIKIYRSEEDNITIIRGRGRNVQFKFLIKAKELETKKSLFLFSKTVEKEIEKEIQYSLGDNIPVNTIQYDNVKESQLLERIIKFSAQFEELLTQEQSQKDQKQQEVNEKLKQERSAKLAERQQWIDELKFEFDQNKNGVVDDIESSEDFNKLLRKHQESIIKVNDLYVNKLVKLSSFLQTNRDNVNRIFNSLNVKMSDHDIESTIGVLKNLIHTYKLMLFHSINMVTSLVHKDLVTFNEIYESFDKLKVFESNWEKNLNEQLNKMNSSISDVNSNLRDLQSSMENLSRGVRAINKSIQTMAFDITSEIANLTYVTESSFDNLSKNVVSELKSIDSSIRVNNLLSSIQTYQLYKINTQTKGLN